MKACSDCKKVKKASDFYIDRSRKHGRERRCRACSSIRSRSPEKKYTNYRYGALRRGINFDLSYAEFLTFWQEPCFYCGSEVKTIGLDRVDNSKGYIYWNIKSCCFRCNTAKNHLSKEVLLKIAKTVAEQ